MRAAAYHAGLAALNWQLATVIEPENTKFCQHDDVLPYMPALFQETARPRLPA